MTYLVAKEAFSYVDRQGVPRSVTPGLTYDDADPEIAKRAHLFESVAVNAERRFTPVEEATAEPGVLRSVRGPRKKRSDHVVPVVAPAVPVEGDGGTVGG